VVRLAGVAGLGLVVAVALAGCGGDGAAPRTIGASVTVSAPSGPRNDVDLAFAGTMIPHAVQALASTQLAGQKATTQQIRTLASAIAAAQQPQIETLSAWLISWGQPLPDGRRTTSGGAAISSEDLNDLAQATGPAFDRLWLETMIRHQQVGLALAETELKRGENPGIKQMARGMLDERKAQVTTMQGLLG